MAPGYREHLSVPELIEVMISGAENNDKDRAAKALVIMALSKVEMLVLSPLPPALPRTSHSIIAELE